MLLGRVPRRLLTMRADLGALELEADKFLADAKIYSQNLFTLLRNGLRPTNQHTKTKTGAKIEEHQPPALNPCFDPDASDSARDAPGRPGRDTGI